jgi:hypothetical protein
MHSSSGHNVNLPRLTPVRLSNGHQLTLPSGYNCRNPNCGKPLRAIDVRPLDGTAFELTCQDCGTDFIDYEARVAAQAGQEWIRALPFRAFVPARRMTIRLILPDASAFMMACAGQANRCTESSQEVRGT